MVGGPGHGVSAPSGSSSSSSSSSSSPPPGAGSARSDGALPRVTLANGGPVVDLDPQERDRVFGVLAAAQGASGRGELSVAARLLDSIGAKPIHPILVPEFESARTSLRVAVGDVTAHIAVDLDAGRALRAAARVEALLSELHPVVGAALEEEWERRDWPPRLRVAPIPTMEREPALRDRRAVAMAVGTQWREGTVVGAAADGGELTVRVETEAGVVFPTVSRAQVEPIEPTAVETEAQLRACLAAGRTAAAWAWWAIARLRGHSLDPELVRVLRAQPR